MKKPLSLLFLLFILINILTAQNTNFKTKEQYEKEIETAVANGDFELAAKLKKEEENRIKSIEEIDELIEQAIQNEKYEEAADLKNEKQTIIQINDAITSGDYELAAKLKNQLTGNNSSLLTQPEYINQVYLKNESNGELNSLDKEKGEIKSKTVAAPFYASSTSYYFIAGNHASVDAKPNATFIVKTSPGVDPEENFFLVKFDPDNDGYDRYMPYYKYSGSVYSGDGGKTNENNVEISFKRLDGDVYEIIPESNLANGEYGFMYIDKFYCFRVGNGITQNNDDYNETSKNSTNYILKSRSFFMGGSVGFLVYRPNFSYSYNSYNYSALSSYGAFGLNYKVGTKWNFGNNTTYKPGLQITWAKVGLYVAYSGETAFANVAPVNAGFTNTIAFNDKIGIEVNANVGPTIMGPTNGLDSEGVTVGVQFNPEFLFRLNRIYMGYNLEIHHGVIVDSDFSGNTSTFVSSAAIGVKF